MYTASWTAARADVHSQQRFFCLMEEGEVSGYVIGLHWVVLVEVLVKRMVLVLVMEEGEVSGHGWMCWRWNWTSSMKSGDVMTIDKMTK